MLCPEVSHTIFFHLPVAELCSSFFSGNLAFGTVDSPNPLLSSSPAAPSTTGGHLADAVKSFGSIDAESSATAGASMIRPPRRSSGSNPAGSGGAAPQKKLDVHSLFAGKPQQSNAAPSGTPMSPSSSQGLGQAGSPANDRRQSVGPLPGINGMPGGPHQYQQMQGVPNQPHLRPPQGVPGQPRSPVMGGAQQPFAPGQMPPQQYRAQQPQMQNQQPVRPGSGPMGMARPMMNQQGMPYAPHGQGGGAFPVMYPGGQNYYGVSSLFDSAYVLVQPI